MFRNHLSRLSPRLLASVGALAGTISHSQEDSFHANSSCEEEHKHFEREKRSRLVFLGTGSSTGCPKPHCPILFSPGNNNPSNMTPEQLEVMRKKCLVSNLAIQGDPRTNPNYRNNPCLLIAHHDPQSGTTKNIVIDAGKTFREGALRWFPVRGVQSLDAVILTHEHMDAAGGLDDIRGFQKMDLSEYDPSDPKSRPKQIPMEIYLSQWCLDKLSKQFTWLFPAQNPLESANDDGKPLVERHVASFDVRVVEQFQPFHVQGLSVVPLPVIHGEDLISLGFAFTVGNTNVVYLSDISRMPSETLEYIQTKLPPTDILVIDSLHPRLPNPVHFSLKDARRVIDAIPSKAVYLVGMNCDSFLPHNEMNTALRRLYGNIQLARDGLEIPC